MSTNPPTGPSRPTGPVYTLATWQQRVGGYFIDWILGAAIYLIGVALAGALDANIVATLFSLLAIAFSIWQWYRQGVTGQTIGKGVVGLKLVRENDANVVGPGLSIGRGFLHIIDSAACLVGWFLPLFDAKRQTIADKIVQTVVVEA